MKPGLDCKNQKIVEKGGWAGGYCGNQGYVKLLAQGGAHGMVASNNNDSGEQQQLGITVKDQV